MVVKGGARERVPEGVIAAGLVVLAVGTAGMLREVEPFATWYYFFAWAGTLLVADGLVAVSGAEGQRGRFLLLGRRAHLLTLLAWSAVIWLFYELLNFRLRNWYYVFLPNDRLVRWSGAVLAFATVLPAVLVSESLLRGARVARGTRWPSFRVTSTLLHVLRAAGAVMLALVLIWPRYFFPLVWGATTLLVEPSVYRRDPARSLLGDLEQGRPGRVLRLLLGGACIGLLWEVYNVQARAKWIYTVPGFEELKLFEMPVLGFLGFPPFALECFVLWQALVLAGLAVPRYGAAVPAPSLRRWAAAALAPVFSVVVLLGMEERTVSSLAPRIGDLPDVPRARLERAGFDAFRLARTAPEELASHIGAAVDDARGWVETARLATLRGIGARHAATLRSLGIRSIEELARREPCELARRLAVHTGEPVIPARVRVWIRAAQRIAS